MPGHVLDACFVEDLRVAGLLAASCTNLEQPMVGGFAASADTELASRVAELVRYGVRVRHLTSLELSQHELIQVHCRALSVADAEALLIARAEEAVLLTGDGQLRKAALDAGVDVRGVIGELKRLVAAVIIDPPRALVALEAIVASGSRLPHDEVEAARRQWFKLMAKGRGAG
jgi:predicted nucleic acid-binding protein